jgi:hypothetical protein
MNKANPREVGDAFMTRKLIAATAAVVCAALWSAAPASASTAWRVQQVPAPGNNAAQLQAVSCPAPGICFAVGNSVATGTFTESTLAERWSGGQWAIQPTPSPGTGGIDQLTGISCLSATDCTAVGIIDTQTAANSTLVEHWDGTSWTVVPSPDPVGTTVTDFTGVSCASATSCTAVGVYDTSGHRPHELPLAEHWDGTKWTVTRVPLPDGITAGDLDGGVSCPSAIYCIAVGSTATQPLAERWNGTRWTVQATPIPVDAYNPFLSGVSCSAPAHCTAVGGYLANGITASSLVERRDSTAWTIQADATSGGLTGVSCTSSTSCTAVGGPAEHWDGTSWTSQPLPDPHHTTRGFAVLGVSCVSAVTCTAAGSYGKTPHPVAWHE